MATSRKKPAIGRLKPQTDVKRARYSQSQDRFVSGWDGIAGEAQRAGRVAKRYAMGQQQVPRGPKGTGT